ncbi:amidohydrolase [Amycolatopsis cihanbeyliensis]|uniref:Amidohydrolase 3 domain-containing protein n=1 Tax=Amycolatopsis cihanbeyliensis TaxID=1128664 RepID=A0A542DQE0_AMYCI|nr:amidohydrolase [Amycolatopsis cihanbeyliensis]TQJ05319.1 hypothetical protein FB471_5147 [Amycolatopsis cihanbeyliensis]
MTEYPLIEAPITLVRARRIRSLTDPEPEALAIAGERIVDAGGWDTLRGRFPRARQVDFGSATMVPGLNDAHAHPSLHTSEDLYADLAPTSTPTATAVRDALAELAARTPEGEWVVGHNFDLSRTRDGDRVDRALLDEVSRRHPVLVIHYSYHAAVANSAALRAGGYRDDSADPVGGRLGRDAAGRLDGVVHERAWMEAYLGHGGRQALVPHPTLDTRVTALARTLERFNAAGVTSVCDAMVHPDDWRVYQEAHRRGLLTARVGMLLWYEFFRHAAELGMATGLGDEWLRFTGVKMMTDGASSGGTCLCTAGARGIQLMPDEEIDRTVREVHAAGSTVAVHANGDIAVGKVLDAIESAQREVAGNRRHRIEHCSMADTATARRLHGAGVVPVPFGAFVHYHGHNFVKHYGHETAATMCPHRTFLDAGLAVPGSSDYPCGPLEPLLALRSMTTRRAQDGTVLGAGERLSATEALHAYTVGSAYASGEETVKGRLAPGMLADFVLLDQDPLTVEPTRLDALRPLATWVGGRQVWAADQQGETS